jgi:hypothetical protein
MKPFINFHTVSLNKRDEELCGDQVRILRTSDQTRIVLSDGLGSGVKANILAALTAEIIINMLREESPLADVIETVMQTLPVDRQQKVAYATFTVLEVDNRTLHFQIYDFDNPWPLLFRDGKNLPIEPEKQVLVGRKITSASGTFQMGDFIALFSDGMVGAGSGMEFNPDWDLEHIIRFTENIFPYHPTGARTFIQMLSGHTRELYQNQPADDATLAGLFIRPCETALVFTGPPVLKQDDIIVFDKLLNFEGKKIICGDTSGTIVARRIGQKIKLDLSTNHDNIPPIGILPGIDLLTEGILTLSKTLEYLEACQGDIRRVPNQRTGATLLTQSLLQADEITFLVGQKINPQYQNPGLPLSVSIRKVLVEKICAELSKLDKTITTEYY